MTGSESEAHALWAEACDLEEAGDITEAMRLYLMSASTGYTPAQLNLGNLLDDRAVPRRPTEAVYWYKRAVKGGEPRGAWNLAMHHRRLGSRRWYLHWLRVAAAMGEQDARAAVAALPLRGSSWWILEDVLDPPTARIGFEARVVPLR